MAALPNNSVLQHLGYNPAKNYAAAAGGKRKVTHICL